MLQRPFRFLHAADLHVDVPCQTALDAPDHLVDLLIESPLRAAAKVFDTALDQRVDFVVLSGDVVDPHHAAPHELLFLVEQFQRLADHNIPVYWSGGVADSVDRWPSYVVWPSNVHRFACGRAERYRHEIAGTPVCEMIGCSHALQPPRPYDFAPSDADLFSIAVAHADWNAGALGEIGVRYWALGGQHARSTPLESNSVAHYAGSPQGRHSNETGPHGCTLVAIDQHGRVELTPLACDVLRWLKPQLSLPPTVDRSELERLLHDRTAQLVAESPGVTLLATWQVACHGSLRFALRHSSLGAELVSQLHQEFGHKQSPVWTLAVEAELPEKLPAQWFAEETLRGDFLRAVRQCTAESLSDDATPAVPQPDAAVLNQFDIPELQQLQLTLPANLADLLTTENLSTSSAQAIAPLAAELDSPAARRRLLREVTWLGADLLSPAEASP